MVQVFKYKEQISKAAADLFTEAAQKAVKNSGRFNVALTGGSSPKGLYEFLSQEPYRDQIPWKQTFIFWGDERWVPLTDAQSNAKMAFDILLNKVQVPPDQIFPMWDTETPEIFAQEYQSLLQNHFGQPLPAFDLILLGMGDDGHTASLFPGTSVLQEKEKLVEAYYLEPQKMYRITLTASCLNQAKKILFITFGEQKAHALKEVLTGKPNPTEYPAQLIKPEKGEVYWFIDEAAAKYLNK